MSFAEWKALTGTCLIVLDGKQFPYTLCELDFIKRRLVCLLKADVTTSLSIHIDGNVSVETIVLNSPSGPLHAKTVDVAFAANVSGPSISIDKTALGHTLGVKPQLIRIEFVLNKPLMLNASYSAVEWMYNGTFETLGGFDVQEGFTITGGKQYVSARGDRLPESPKLTTCIGMLVGAPIRPIVIQEGFEIRIVLNNFEPMPSKPLVIDSVTTSSGEWKHADTLKKNAANLAQSCLSYMDTLDSVEFSRFSNAVSAFLQTRVASQSLELTLLGAFYFLEWLDDTRRLSENAIAKVLEVDRKEANILKRVRDNLVHNRQLLVTVIDDAVRNLRSVPNAKFIGFDHPSNSYAMVNYLMTLLTTALLRRVGYSGEAKPFLPIRS